MRKFKIFIDYDKEEQWLNQMATKGYELTNKGFTYTFKEVSPTNSTHKIDYRTFETEDDFNNYCALFEDSGWKLIVGDKNGGNLYFKNISKNPDNDIFSDNTSKAERYNQFIKLYYFFIGNNVFWMFYYLFFFDRFITFDGFIDPKSLFSPELWNLTGLQFLSNFLVEGTLAFVKGYLWLIFPITTVIFIGYIIKAKKLRDRLLEKNI